MFFAKRNILSIVVAFAIGIALAAWGWGEVYRIHVK